MLPSVLLAPTKSSIVCDNGCNLPQNRLRPVGGSHLFLFYDRFFSQLAR